MRCTWKKCQNESEIIYIDRPLCWKHWKIVCKTGEIGDDEKRESDNGTTILS